MDKLPDRYIYKDPKIQTESDKDRDEVSLALTKLEEEEKALLGKSAGEQTAETSQTESDAEKKAKAKELMKQKIKEMLATQKEVIKQKSETENKKLENLSDAELLALRRDEEIKELDTIYAAEKEYWDENNYTNFIESKIQAINDKYERDLKKLGGQIKPKKTEPAREKITEKEIPPTEPTIAKIPAGDKFILNTPKPFVPEIKTENIKVETKELTAEQLKKEIGNNLDKLLAEAKDIKKIESFDIKGSGGSLVLDTKMTVHTGDRKYPNATFNLKVIMENKQGGVGIGGYEIYDVDSMFKFIRERIKKEAGEKIGPKLPSLPSAIQEYLEKKYGKKIKFIKIKNGSLVFQYE